MGVGSSLVVFAAGAILRFAASVTAPGFEVHQLGVLLMVVGAIAFVVSLVFWSSWGGFGGNSHLETSQEGSSGIARTGTDEFVG